MTETASNPFIYCNEPIAGLDCSLRSPALVVVEATSKPSFLVDWKDCHAYYLTDKISLAKTSSNINGALFGAWHTPPERYETIAEWVVKTLQKHNVKHLGIEGYAYSANFSSLTLLAENMGLLKYHLYKASITYDEYTPSSIKKAASGNGAAKKPEMRDSFVMDTGFDIMGHFGRKPTDKPISPINDICDAYYLACSARIARAVQNRDFDKPIKPKAKKGRK